MPDKLRLEQEDQEDAVYAAQVYETLGVPYAVVQGYGGPRVVLEYWSIQDILDTIPKNLEDMEFIDRVILMNSGKKPQRDPKAYLENAKRALWAMGDLEADFLHGSHSCAERQGLALAIRHFQTSGRAALERLVALTGPTDEIRRLLFWFCRDREEDPESKN